MSAKRIAELEAAIDAIGRPRLVLYPLPALLRARAAVLEWEAAHAEAAAEYRRLLEELDREVKRAEREESERQRIDRALRNASTSGAGARALEAAAAPKDTEALGVVRRWLATEKSWLVVCGAPGGGKTVAATVAVRETLKAGQPAAFRRVSEVAKLSSFEAGAVELGELKRVKLLVLDDFGAETWSDYAKAQLHELMDTRHERPHLRTIITSNLKWNPDAKDAQGLRGRLGERLVDRIAQSGTLQQLGDAPSMRRLKLVPGGAT